ncbi:MAG: hypothetical protein R3261_14870, partial [Alphaproteobacteria bacterium]|nr:hypothetical protein [Alphaproteobacteria bacterium]
MSNKSSSPNLPDQILDKTLLPQANLFMHQADGGRMAENIVHFTRILRKAGLPVGPGKSIDAIKAVSKIGLGSRDDFYWTLHAIFVSRRDQKDIFNQAFHIFWRNPNLLEKMMHMLLPSITDDGNHSHAKDSVSPRIRDAMRGDKDSNPPDIEPNSDDEEAELELDASLTFSRNEILTNKDFEKMTSEELALAKQAISRLKLPINPIKSRRFTTGKHHGLVDAKTTMKASTRRGSDIIHLKYKQRKTV